MVLITPPHPFLTFYTYWNIFSWLPYDVWMGRGAQPSQWCCCFQYKTISEQFQGAEKYIFLYSICVIITFHCTVVNCREKLSTISFKINYILNCHITNFSIFIDYSLNMCHVVDYALWAFVLLLWWKTTRNLQVVEVKLDI